MKLLIAAILFISSQTTLANIIAYQQHSKWIVKNTSGDTLIEEYFLTNPKVTKNFFAYELHGHAKVINKSGEAVFSELGINELFVTDNFAAFQKYGVVHVFDAKARKVSRHEYPIDAQFEDNFYVITTPLTHVIYNRTNQKILERPRTSKIAIKDEYVVETTYSNQTTVFSSDGEPIMRDMFVNSLLLP